MMILPLTGVFAGGQTEDGAITVGANIYSFQDNFMNGVIKPELDRYAEELGLELDVVDSEASRPS